VTIYQITLRDRETQTVVGYYNGAWTTDQRRALAFRGREAAEAHAARRSLSAERRAHQRRGDRCRQLALNTATRRARRRSVPKMVLSHCESQRSRLCAWCGNSPTVAVSIMQELAQRLAEVTELAVSTDRTKPGPTQNS
jgi:hypothetical protein